MLNRLLMIFTAILMATGTATAATIEEFFAQPICYLEATDSDIPDGNGGLQQNETFIQLNYVKFTPQLIGIFNYLPAGVDSTRGVLASYDLQKLPNATDVFLLKTFHHVSVEGYNAINEQYFMVSGDKIAIGFGPRSDGELPDIYFYKNPDNMDYRYSLPRVDC